MGSNQVQKLSTDQESNAKDQDGFTDVIRDPSAWHLTSHKYEDALISPGIQASIQSTILQ